MKNPLYVALYMMIAAAVLFGSVVLGSKFLTAHSDATTICKTTGETHYVTIKNSVMSPESLTAPRCDKVNIKNYDNVIREIGFGEHDHHAAYDGVSEKVLHQGESFTFTLVQKGTFPFHDHFHDEVAGHFSVK